MAMLAELVELVIGSPPHAHPHRRGPHGGHRRHGRPGDRAGDPAGDRQPLDLADQHSGQRGGRSRAPVAMAPA